MPPWKRRSSSTTSKTRPSAGIEDKGGGNAGKALCGVAVPEDNPDRIVRWVATGRECKRCRTRLDRYGS